MGIFGKPLFTFEMANNHQGSVSHGISIINALGRVIKPYRDEFNFAVKFQYRDLDTFIRPDYINREDVKNVKRFKDTKLSEEQFLALKSEVEKNGMYTMCTPFDEKSVDNIIKHNYDIVKIASCSFADWPLMEKIATARKPVIASTAASSIDNIDRVVSFFKHRNIELALMHCVAEYPTNEENLEMNQIDLLKERYPETVVGFSTHEEPADMEPIKIAVAKGALIFERHVGVETDNVKLNAYSATPKQIEEWLEAAKRAYKMCGVKGARYVSSGKEQADLEALQRGVFARNDVNEGSYLSESDVTFAFPCEKGQLLSNRISKYTNIIVKKNIEAGRPIYLENVYLVDIRPRIAEIVKKVINLLKKSHVVLPVNSSCEISHHYGIDRYDEIGVTIIDCINREYCKKLLVVLPGQKHPIHMHKKKEETFTVLYGDLEVVCDGKKACVKQGESMVVERGVNHSFASENGCIFEEVSTTHYKDDSFYEKESEFVTPRKTKVYLTNKMLMEFEAEI